MFAKNYVYSDICLHPPHAHTHTQKLQTAVAAARAEADILRGLLDKAAVTAAPSGFSEGADFKGDYHAACRRVGELSSAIEARVGWEEEEEDQGLHETHLEGGGSFFDRHWQTGVGR